jgi:hypothetical protein
MHRRLLCGLAVVALFGAAVVLVSVPGAGGAGEPLITVDTASDAHNGDVSSPMALQANPGPDGISLREAIEATNNQPGSYDIRFAASLRGATILVGATCCGDLPPMTGGNLSIDGDVDGDGRPDITLQGGGLGFNVVSSRNRLNALRLRGFTDGVLFTAATLDQALPSGRTFTGNVVSGLVMTGVSTGIRISPTGPPPGHNECVRSACQTANRWTNMQLAGNTIAARGGANPGVDVRLEGVARNTVSGLSVEGNAIHVARRGPAINLMTGSGAHADKNRLEDVLVAHNSLDLPEAGYGIFTWSGARGGSENVVEGLRIRDNTIRFTGDPGPGPFGRGIQFAASDDCFPPGGCLSRHAISPKRNAVRSVRIVGNVVEGKATGIVITDPCCGGHTGSHARNIRIAQNTIRTTLPRRDRNPLGIAISTAGADVSNVVVDRNTVMQRAPGARSRYAAYLAGGGIGLLGGLAKQKGSLRDVVVSRNRLDTPLAGITVLGGGPSGDEPAHREATANRVYGVRLLRNRILRRPKLAMRWNRQVRGISVIGGLGVPRRDADRWRRSVHNSVRCVRLRKNVVAGKRDASSVFANLGAHAARNEARLGGC